jgi:hypothetical protein
LTSESFLEGFLEEMNDPQIVHGLWIKGRLSPLEQLTISSYIAQGFLFKLWVYDDWSLYAMQEGLELKDAGSIIPPDQVFSYRHSNQFGHGKGSYAGFSDVFRYKLLYEQGGWWTDMDVTCLAMPKLLSPYVFRLSKHREDWIVGNIMKVPAGSELMKACYDDALVIDEDNRDWMAPIKILNHHINRLGLREFIQVLSNDDSWPVVSRMIIGQTPPEPQWCFIHWMNEEFRRLGLPKNVYKGSSTLGRLMARHGLGEQIVVWISRLEYRVKAGRLYYALLHFRRETFLLSVYYLGYNVFYALSDLYFVTIKPHFDIGGMIRKLFGNNRTDKRSKS